MKKQKMRILPGVALLSFAGVVALATVTVDSLMAAPRAAMYTLVYNLCNGQLQYVKGQEGSTVKLASPSRDDGYGFLGWSRKYDHKKKMGVESDMIQEENYTFAAKNEVLYAVWTKGGSHSSEEIEAYYKNLGEVSQDGHLYVHYYRWNHNPEDYAKWDIWCWPYRPEEGEGYAFDFAGIDDYGGAICDIDMTKTYDGGWDNVDKKIGGTPVSFITKEGKLEETVGIQFVRKADRQSAAEFWGNDGGNIYIKLEDFAYPLDGGGTAYHVFAVQDSTQDCTAKPLSADERVDPFENDDGTNVTKGDSRYDNVDWSDIDKAATAPAWKNIGAGYQIMVASFADSDGDGFGDIYGITQKLDYIAGLNVKALWLTPIQKSDSYHGYDISDYEKVDVKFGSKASPNAFDGEVTEDSAMKDYEDLIAAANAKGIKIVMDLVLNHTSTSNPWFIRSGQLDPEYRGYYQWANHTKDPSINQKSSWYPYGDHDYSYYAKFGSGMPELNYSFKSTREAVEDMTCFWIEKGVTGFRLDAVKHIFMKDESDNRSTDTIINDIDDADPQNPVDYSSNMTKNLHFYKELNKVAKQKNPDAFFVGENFDGHAYQVGPYYEAFDSMFDFYTYFNLTSMAAMIANPNGGAKGFANGWMTGTSTDIGVQGKEYNVPGLKKTWNAPAVYSDYSTWRGDNALPGCFTSNHDIARTINRLAGTGNAQGLTEQGKIEVNNFDYYNKFAMVVKLAEIFMPGVTWVYYGDEIGMTGNFLLNAEHSKDDYADLAYRQPMKWTQDGKVGDGSLTTGYAINGAKTAIYLDEVNASTKVKPANSQFETTGSDYDILSKAIKLKNDNPAALVIGNFTDAGSQNSVLKFNRSGGGKTYVVTADFTNQTFTVSLNGNNVFTY